MQCDESQYYPHITKTLKTIQFTYHNCFRLLWQSRLTYSKFQSSQDCLVVLRVCQLVDGFMTYIRHTTDTTVNSFMKLLTKVLQTIHKTTHIRWHKITSMRNSQIIYIYICLHLTLHQIIGLTDYQPYC